MFDKDSGYSGPSVGQVSSSKTVCAKRVGGWIILVAMVLVFVYGGALVINSRSQRHYDEVYQLDEAVTVWTNDYEQSTQSWKPVLSNSLNEEFPLDELNTPDFKSQYSDVDPYKVVKYQLGNIEAIVKSQQEKVVYNGTNGEFNITTTLLLNFDGGQSLSLEDIPLYVKKRSHRSSKDCTLNRMGIWNSTDHRCYTFNQAVHLCYIIDSDNFPSLASEWEVFPGDQVNRYYASYTFYRWTDPDSNPGFSDFHSAHDISITIRSNRDPYVVGYTQVDIMKNTEDNTMLFYGVIIGVLGLLAGIVPFKLIMAEDGFEGLSAREKIKFMRRV